MTERDGAMSECWSVTEQWQTWPQLMCCALALKNLVSVNFRLRKKKRVVEQRWSGVDQGAE